MDIGTRIRKRREELHLTQEELATKCGYKSRSSVNKIELQRSLPLPMVEKFAIALDCDPAYLMGWEDELGQSPTLKTDYSIEEVTLMNKYSRLNSDNRLIVINLIDSLLKTQK